MSNLYRYFILVYLQSSCSRAPTKNKIRYDNVVYINKLCRNNKNTTAWRYGIK